MFENNSFAAVVGHAKIYIVLYKYIYIYRNRSLCVSINSIKL